MAYALRPGVILVATLAGLAGHSQAALVGQSNAPTGQFRYEGLGPISAGVGSGRYYLGDCLLNAGTTTCTVSGSYVETAASSRSPGDTGSFVLSMSYPGAGPSPVIARSVSAGSNVLQLSELGAGSFALAVTTSNGSSYSGVFPATPFADSIGWSAFLSPNSFGCTGLAGNQACSVAQVGLTPGAAIFGAISPLTITLPTSAIPEPGTALMLVLGAGLLAGLPRWRRAAG